MIIKSESAGALSINGALYAKGSLVFSEGTQPNTTSITTLASSQRCAQRLFVDVKITDIKPSADGEAFEEWADFSAYVLATCYTSGGELGGLSAIVVTVEDEGDTVTDSRLIGKTVYLLLINDASKNTGFDQPDEDGAVLFTDGTNVAAGQKVTFIYI